MHQNSNVDSISPQHAILEILPQVKMDKILQYKKDKTLQQDIKNKSCISHQFSIDHLNHPCIQNLTNIFKQLKPLKYLNMNLSYLLYSHEGMQRLTESLKHNKNLSLLHLHASMTLFPISPFSLCQALNNSLADLPKLQIRLSFSVSRSDGDDYLISLLRSLSKIRSFTSIDLAFSNYSDRAKLQTLIALLMECNYLCNISLAFKSCAFQPDLFGDLKEIKSLKNFKILFENCRVSSPRLRLLASVVKKLARKSNIQITFKNCDDSLSVVDWWLFRRSLKNGKNYQKIEVKFIGGKGVSTLIARVICILLLIGLIGLLLTPFIFLLAFISK